MKCWWVVLVLRLTSLCTNRNPLTHQPTPTYLLEGWEWGGWQTPSTGQTPNCVKQRTTLAVLSSVLCSSISVKIAFTVKRRLSPKKPWIVAGCVWVGGWVGCCWARTSPINISLLATALAVFSLFLCSSISPRIAVNVNRCVWAKRRNLELWMGGNGLVGEWDVCGCVQHHPPTFPS